MKKILAILLSLALVICMLPASAVTAWADGPNEPNAITITPNDGTVYYDGRAKTPNYTVKCGSTTLYKGTGYTVEIKKGENTLGATESLVDAGTYKIKVTSIDKKTNSEGATASYDFQIFPRDISNATITCNPWTMFYEQGGTPAITVKDTGLNRELTEDTDYSKEVKQNGSRYDVVITGKGNYDPAKTKSTYYTVNPFDLGASTISFSADVTEEDTTEQAILSKIVLKQNNVVIPEKLWDATVTNFSGSSFTVSVSAKKGADGNAIKLNSTKKQTFTKKCDISKYDSYEFVFSGYNAYNDQNKLSGYLWNFGNEIKPSFTLNLKKAGKTVKTISSGSGYLDIKYSSNTDPGSASVQVTGKSDKGYTGNLNGNFDIYKRNIKNCSFTTGNVGENAGSPSVIVKDGDRTLVEDTDYNCNITANDSKKMTFTVSGTGNYYTGEKTGLTCNIVKADYDLTGSEVKISGVYYFTGEYIVPETKEVTVTLVKQNGTKITVPSGSYKIAASNNKDVGPATLEIIGIGSYGGSKLETFDIKQTDLKNAKITGVNTSYTYTGKEIKPTPTVTIYGKTINKKYYDVTYYLNTKVTTKYSPATVRVTANSDAGSNMTGLKEADFNIVEASTSSWTAEFKDGKDNRNYDGKASFPAVVVKAGTKTLYEGSDYTITYKDSKGNTVTGGFKEIGEYRVMIEGITYAGTKTLTFTINGSSLANFIVTLKDTQVTADGTRKTPVIVSVKSGSTTLASDSYTVSYQDSLGNTVYSLINPDTYKVVVTGKNGYSGSTYANFRIKGIADDVISGVASSYKLYPNSTSSSTIQLAPTATEAKNFTYTSSDSSIASVSSTGLVTAYKAGRAKITIKTTGNTKYDPATFSTVIKVYPKKAVMTRKPWTTAKKGQAKVRWNKQDNVTRYEIRYSRAKNFAKGTYITKKVNAAQNDYTTQSTTISKLKSGYKYYVKVRAVKEVYNDNGKMITYYGNWSGWKSVVVK